MCDHSNTPLTSKASNKYSHSFLSCGLSMCTNTTPEFNGPSTCTESIHYCSIIIERSREHTWKFIFRCSRPRPSFSTALLCRSVCLLSLKRYDMNLRDGSVPCPSAPSTISKRFDISPVPEYIRAPSIILDAFNSFLELPCLAIRGEDFGVKQREDTNLYSTVGQIKPLKIAKILQNSPSTPPPLTQLRN